MKCSTLFELLNVLKVRIPHGNVFKHDWVSLCSTGNQSFLPRILTVEAGGEVEKVVDVVLQNHICNYGDGKRTCVGEG